MDRCAYCGYRYHPMAVWVRGMRRINVCSVRIRRNDDGSIYIDPELGRPVGDPSDCPDLARADGFTPAPDLTPKF